MDIRAIARPNTTCAVMDRTTGIASKARRYAHLDEEEGWECLHDFSPKRPGEGRLLVQPPPVECPEASRRFLNP